MPGVERSMHILKPYKLVGSGWHKASTVVRRAGRGIGGSEVQVNRRSLLGRDGAADAGRPAGVKPPGRRLMRGGAFKPRPVPTRSRARVWRTHDAQGRAPRRGSAIVTELMDVRMLDHLSGAPTVRDPDRHAQHAELRLLKEVGRSRAGHPEARHERDESVSG